MGVRETARQITTGIVEPLCEESERLFRPIEFWDTDILSVDLDKTGTKFVTQVSNKDGGPYISGRAAHDWVGRVPERRRIGHGKFELAATDFTALIINSLWKRATFTDSAQIVYDYLLTKFVVQTHFAKIATNGKRADVLAEMKRIKHVDRVGLPLMPHQQVGLAGCYKKDGFALFMEQGTGKTPIVIARICREAAEKDGLYRALIVCPKNVRHNWQVEVGRFATTSGQLTVIRGDGLNRVKQLIDALQTSDGAQWTIIVASYDTVAMSWDAFKMIGWDLAVLDESHKIKSSGTKRWKKMKELRERCKQRMVLTGTPVTNNGVFDLWTQLEFLGEGWSGFTSFKRYREFYGRYVRQDDGRRKNIGFQHLPLIQERLARCCYMATKAQVLPDLPKKVYDVYEVEMGKDQTAVYKQIADKLYFEIQDDLDTAKNKEMVILNVLTKLLRLAQITSGFVTFDAQIDEEGTQISPKTVKGFVPNAKLDALVEILTEKKPGSKTAIWACWTNDINCIEHRLKSEGFDCVTLFGKTSDTKREEAIDRFNDDKKCSVFIGNPAAGGTGINLQKSGCDHVIYYSQTWSMVARTQSEDRFHRMGTKCVVRYTDLCVPATIDEEIRTHVLRVRGEAAKIQDIRGILSRIAAFKG